MKIKILIVLIGSFITNYLHAVTLEEKVFYSFRLTLELYKKEHNSLPDNWDSLIKSGFFLGAVRDDTHKFLDIENRYFFTNISTVFDGGIVQERIILMAKQAGGEGDIRRKNDDGKIEQYPGRLLIVETIDGKIDSGHFSEKQLQAMFDKAGLKLADYTFTAPPLPNKVHEGKPDPSEKILDDPNNHTSSGTSVIKNPEGREKKPKSSGIEDRLGHPGSFSTWLIWLGGIFIAIISWIIWRWAAQKSKF